MSNACFLSLVRTARFAEALEVEEYLAQPTAQVERCREALTGIIPLRVVTVPPEGQVTVGDRRYGPAPVTVRLPVPWWEQRVTVTFADESVDVDRAQLMSAFDANACGMTDLVVEGPGAASSRSAEQPWWSRSAPASSGPAGPAAGSSAGGGSATEPRDDGGSTMRALGWVSGGLAVASVAGAVIAWRIREDQAAVWNDERRCLQPGLGSREEQCSGVRDDIELADTAIVVTLVGAGVFAAASITLFALAGGGGDESPDQAGNARCGAGPGLAGVACTLAF